MHAYRPHIAVIFLHPGCNMTCSFCVTENAFSAMRFDQALHLLDTLKQRGFDTVVLGGGEPFTWRHSLVDLAHEAKARRFVVQVGTNGTVLPENYAEIPWIDRYVLPLDAAESAGHNRLRHFQDRHHSVIMDRLARLKSAGKSVTISTVVTAQNIGGLGDVADFLTGYARGGGPLHAWHLYKFIPQGRGGHRNAGDLEITEDVYHAACAAAKSRCLGFDVFKRRDMFHSRTVDFFWYHRDTIQVGSDVWSRTPSTHTSTRPLPAAADSVTR